ncbi:MAG TPA: hypothetical protein P5110_06580 [Candidatus Omnitrophota bacterium]|nr:hypothetical protein [Candidatus Omnitrophota bacterium]HRZ15155.1 hypothetical protein [Candidatus Omnitrophota bacterium]
MRNVLLAAVLASVLCSCVYAEQATKMLVETPPQETIFVAENEAQVPAARYPKFAEFSGDNPNCEAYLQTDYSGSGDEADGIAQNGLSQAPLNLRSKMGSGSATGSKMQFVSISEQGSNKPFAVDNYQIPAEYRKTAKLLISWTVRIEGWETPGMNISPGLCSNWYGTSIQEFPANDVKLGLFITDHNQEVRKGAEGSLTIPPGPPQEIIQVPPPPPSPNVPSNDGSSQPANSDWGPNNGAPPFDLSDPVISGSYLLSPSDFENGEFPEVIRRIEIKWQNQTSQILVSPAKMRTLTIMLMPTGKESSGN